VSYRRTLGQLPPPAPPGEARTVSLPPAATTAIVLGSLGLIGLLLYWRFKTTAIIAKKHGVGKALAFEGGMAAIGALNRLADRPRRNPRRRRRRRRR
jgi:hypothetical protein